MRPDERENGIRWLAPGTVAYQRQAPRKRHQVAMVSNMYVQEKHCGSGRATASQARIAYTLEMGRAALSIPAVARFPVPGHALGRPVLVPQRRRSIHG